MGSTTVAWMEIINTSSNEDLIDKRNSIKETVSRLAQEKRILDEQLSRLKMEMAYCEGNISAINRKLEEREVPHEFNKHTDLIVTDHALLRYIERVLKIRVEGLRQDIINGFPDAIEPDCTCVKTGKTLYRLVKDKRHFVIMTIIKKKR